ncbi:MAG: FkbM family methyltransferase [Candidatus Hodarchaeota archaeon]
MLTRQLKLIIVRFVSHIPRYYPDWFKQLVKPLSGIYSYISKIIYSSIKEEILVKTLAGPWIYVNYQDPVERKIAEGIYEKTYVDFFYSKVQSGHVVVDIGAYIGYFSLLASERVGNDGCIYAFEPVPRNYKRLMKNFKLNRVENVKAYNFGLSDKNETLIINVPKENPAESTLYRHTVTEISRNLKCEKASVKIQLKSFDQFCMEEDLNNEVNIVKIDAEGAEFKILKGMETTLRTSNLLLFLEIFPPILNRIGVSLENLITFLTNCGFKTIYSGRNLTRKQIINPNNLNKIVTFILKDEGYNFIFDKNI